MGDYMKFFAKKNVLRCLGGGCIGLLNGLFGSGGGMVAVPLLKRAGLSQADAQANAIAVILPISILSAVLYYMNGNLDIKEAVSYVPTGLLGTVTGTFLLSKIPQKYLRKIFAAFMIWAGVRLILK